MALKDGAGQAAAEDKLKKSLRRSPSIDSAGRRSPPPPPS
jgi:hypothetical protein